MNQYEAILYVKTTPRAAMDTVKLVQYESAFKDNKEFALEYAKVAAHRYHFLSPRLKDDREVMKAYITGDMGSAFAYANPMRAASNRLKDDMKFIVECMEASKKNQIPIFNGLNHKIQELVFAHPDVKQVTEALPIFKAAIELENRQIEYKPRDDIRGMAEKVIAFESMQASLAEKRPSKQPSLKL